MCQNQRAVQQPRSSVFPPHNTTPHLVHSYPPRDIVRPIRGTRDVRPVRRRIRDDVRRQIWRQRVDSDDDEFLWEEEQQQQPVYKRPRRYLR